MELRHGGHLQPADGQGRRHRRVRHADRTAAGRHRPAARPHLEPVRDPQPGRHARAQPGAAAAGPAPGDRGGPSGEAEAARARDPGLRPRPRAGAGGPARHLRRRQPDADAPGAGRQAGRDGLGDAARPRPEGARRPVAVQRVPDDQPVRGLPAVHPREPQPRLPGDQLRHQVRPTRADHRGRRRLPGPRGRDQADGRADRHDADLPRAGREDERGGAGEGPPARARTLPRRVAAGAREGRRAQAAAHPDRRHPLRGRHAGDGQEGPRWTARPGAPSPCVYGATGHCTWRGRCTCAGTAVAPRSTTPR